MPCTHLILLLVCVIFAAGVTIWLFTLGGGGLLIAALPAVLVATLAYRALRR